MISLVLGESNNDTVSKILTLDILDIQFIEQTLEEAITNIDEFEYQDINLKAINAVIKQLKTIQYNYLFLDLLEEGKNE